MPWVWPDAPASYLHLIEAVDRDRFAVHLDPVNLVCSVHRYFANGSLIRECFDVLGPYIRSCHAKDILLRPKLTVHLDEVPPGAGALDYGVFLREADKLDEDLPVLLEHLPNPDDYQKAAEFIRSIARREGVTLR
jgi:sugar phosphate isomerase/epimerase